MAEEAWNEPFGELNAVHSDGFRARIPDNCDPVVVWTQVVVGVPHCTPKKEPCPEAPGLTLADVEFYAKTATAASTSYWHRSTESSPCAHLGIYRRKRSCLGARLRHHVSAIRQTLYSARIGAFWCNVHLLLQDRLCRIVYCRLRSLSLLSVDYPQFVDQFAATRCN